MIKRNLIANYIGQFWSALMSLAFIPLYIKYLGVEAYGLVGLFSVLQISFTLLDMGMSLTLSREMARFRAKVNDNELIRDLLRSVEFIAFVIAIFIGFGVSASANWLATEWVHAEDLSIYTISQAFVVMGVVLAFRFIEGIYRSCLVGLQLQVAYNIVNSFLVTLRLAGAAIILMFLSPTIEAFFMWQALISLISLIAMMFITYGALPESEQHGRFSIKVLLSFRHFAGGVIGITFLALTLTQIDKIILSKLLTLSDYGYYMIATVVSGSLYMLSGPIAQTWFPYLSELHANGRQAELVEKYHQGAQLVSIFMGGTSIAIIIFSENILRLWTQDASLVIHTSSLLRILALGNLLNGLMCIPGQTQLAFGFTGLVARINAVCVIFFVPAIFLVTPRYGVGGAAWIWVALNMGYVIIGIHFMHIRVLVNEKWRWYIEDILKPLTASLLISITMAYLMPDYLTSPYELVWIIATIAFSFVGSAITSEFGRKLLISILKFKIYD